MDIKGNFRLELYSNSLKRLVFVNVNEGEKNDVKEIEFISVFYLEIPPFFDNPVISEGALKDFEYVEKRLKNQYKIIKPFEKVFKITFSNGEFFIGAGKYQVKR